MGRLSEECEYFAYGLSSAGSDWVTVHFLKADDLTKLPDVLERVKFSCLAWTHDAKGIFYNSYPRQDGKADGKCTSMEQLHYFPSSLTSLKLFSYTAIVLRNVEKNIIIWTILTIN